MALNKVSFDIKTTGRTADDVYKDTAIVNGYSATVTEDFTTDLLTQAEKDAFKYPVGTVVGSEKEEQFTQPDGTIMYKLSYTISSANPVTDIEFGKMISDKKFASDDVVLQGKATEIRARVDYNI